MDAERCKLILSVATEGFWDWDLSTDQAYLSPRHCELIGIPPDTLLAKASYLGLIHPGDRQRVAREVEAYLQGGGRGTLVLECRMAAGEASPRWIEWRGRVAQYDDQGRPSRMVGTIVDIGERKEAELCRQAAEEELRTAFEDASDPIFWADAETGILVNCNRAAEQMLEAPRAEVIGRHQTFLHPPERAAHFAELFQKAVQRHEKGEVYEAVVVSKSGRRIPTQVKNSITRIGTRSIMQGVFRDVTGQKIAEAALRHSQKLLSSIVENAPYAFFVKDVRDQFRVILWNGAAERIFGIRAADIIGKNAHDLWPEGQADAFLADDLAVVASGTVVDVPEELSIHPEQGVIYLHTCKVPLLDETGEVQHIAVISEDITSRKKAGEEILALNAGLEQRVRERTVELEAAVQEQEAFSYTVSHDLRAPLRHINSFSAILLEDFGSVLPDEARTYLKRIGGATRKMGDLIDYLLALSQVSRVELTRESVDLSALAAGVATMLRETEPGRCVQFDIAEGLLVQGDRSLLKQLLENLIGNAWKYTSGKPAARIEFGSTEQCGRQCYCIKDNGAGFDMAFSGRLFEAFQRLHGAEFEGTGIGLATAKRIIQRHGGAIWGEGAVDQGAEFCFTLQQERKV